MGGGQSGGGSGGGYQYTKTQTELPEEVKPLFSNTNWNMLALQNAMPLWGGPNNPNFMGDLTMKTAPANSLQTWASGKIPETYAAPEAEKTALQYATQAVAPTTGGNIATDPALKAADDYFQKLILPKIQNQMGLAGLGRSNSLANAMALGQTNYMLPMVQDSLAREEAAKTRLASLVPQLNAIGAQDTARQNTALGQAQTLGGTLRQIEQDANTASYQDLLRRQDLAEKALFTPFGTLVPSSIGQSSASTSTQNTTKSGGGLFK